MYASVNTNADGQRLMVSCKTPGAVITNITGGDPPSLLAVDGPTSPEKYKNIQFRIPQTWLETSPASP